MSFENLFLPKECLAEHPWELDPVDRDLWVNCQASRARIGSYVSAIVILIIIIIAVIYARMTDHKYWAYGIGLFGIFLLVMTLVVSPWWAGKKAGMEFDQFKMKWDRLLIDNKGDTVKTREEFGRENLKKEEIASQYAIANAHANQPGIGTGFGVGVGLEAAKALFGKN